MKKTVLCISVLLAVIMLIPACRNTVFVPFPMPDGGYKFN